MAHTRLGLDVSDCGHIQLLHALLQAWGASDAGYRLWTIEIDLCSDSTALTVLPYMLLRLHSLSSEAYFTFHFAYYHTKMYFDMQNMLNNMLTLHTNLQKLSNNRQPPISICRIVEDLYAEKSAVKL